MEKSIKHTLRKKNITVGDLLIAEGIRNIIKELYNSHEDITGLIVIKKKNGFSWIGRGLSDADIVYMIETIKTDIIYGSGKEEDGL